MLQRDFIKPSRARGNEAVITTHPVHLVLDVPGSGAWQGSACVPLTELDKLPPRITFLQVACMLFEIRPLLPSILHSRNTVSICRLSAVESSVNRQ